jgi:DNA-binding IclR family transcriptional regulator
MPTSIRQYGNDDRKRDGRVSARSAKPIQSVDRAASILEALASGPRRLGVTEIAERLGLARPTVHGLLQTLRAHGFVEQDPESDKYQLGPGLLHLGASYLDISELRGRSIVYAETLAQRANASVRVGVLHGSSVLVIHHVFKPDAAFQVLEVGAELPIHATALGKALLAFGPDELLGDVTGEPLAKLTRRTLSASALKRELPGIRRGGIAEERDEAVLGESSLAAPVFDRSGRAIGAIGVVGDTAALTSGKAARAYPGEVADAAAGLSRELGAPRGLPS